MKRIVPVVLCLLLANINILAFSDADTIKTLTGQDLPETLLLTRPLLSTSNPAALSLISINLYNKSETGVTVENRDLRFIQQPGYIFSYKAKTEGFKSLGRFKYSGSFCYLNEIYEDLIFNSTLEFDPFNSFLVGDTVSGRQKKEQFALNGAIVYKINDRITFGTRIEYRSAIGAKEIDIRNLNKISEFKLVPGVLFKSGNTRFGLSAFVSTYANYISWTTIGNYKYDIFKFRGVGCFLVDNEVDYYDHRFVGLDYGGALQFSTSSDRVEYTGEAEFSYTETDSQYGTAYRSSDGMNRKAGLSLNNTLNVKHMNMLQVFAINADINRLSGDKLEQMKVTKYYDIYSYFAIVDTLYEKNIQISDIISGEAKYSIAVFNDNGSMNLYAGLRGKVEYFYLGCYPLSKHGYYEATNLTFSAEVKKDIWLKNLLIEPYVSVIFRQNVASDVNYVTSNANMPELVYSDYNYITSNLFGGSFSVKFEKQVKGVLKTIYFAPTVALTKSPDAQNKSLKNTMAGMNLGLTFGD